MPVVAGFVPTDEGRAALDVAIVEARRRDAELIVVVCEARGSQPGAAEASLQEVRDRLAAAEVDADVREAEPGGDAAVDIVETAEQVEAEIIVIGLRRRSRVGKLILGSSAQRILLDSTCPVLAVKPKASA